MPYSQDVLATMDIYEEVRPAILKLLDEFKTGGSPWTGRDGRKYYSRYLSNQGATRMKFQEWTGYTQEGLETRWAEEKRIAKEEGRDPHYVSCCESFLNKLVQKLVATGWCPNIPFQSFGLFKLLPYWHWLDAYKPKAGDFFQTGGRVDKGPVPMSAGHVGVIYEIVSEDHWVTIEGGLGGGQTGYDAVGRVDGKPLNVQGCINVDEYFLGLAKPSADQAAQAATGRPVQARNVWKATTGR